MIIKTILVKLNKPNTSKRRILDSALLNYSISCEYLLNCLKDKLDNVPANASKNYFLKLIDGKMLSRLNIFEIEPFKDSIRMDVATMLSSHYARMKNDKISNFPSTFLDNASYYEHFNYVVDNYKNKSELSFEINKLLAKHNNIRPLMFCRYDITRDYSLLYDKDKDRFYAKLYLMNSKSAIKVDNKCEITNLSYIAEGNPPFIESIRARRFIILPLSFGKWQEDILKKAMSEPSILKTASLIKKDNEYYLGIKVACKEKNLIETQTYLSIVRSINHTCTYYICDNQGKFIVSGELDLCKNENSLHLLSNSLVSIALKYKSCIIFYNLVNRTDYLKYEDKKPAILSGDYTKLCTFVSYKSQLEGLPKPIIVSPNGIFHKCPVCSRNSLKNRMNADIFMCISCGHTDSIQKIGGMNLATRILRNKKDKIVFNVSFIGDEVEYSNNSLSFIYRCKKDTNANVEFYSFLLSFLNNFVPSSRMESSIARKLIATSNIHDVVMLLEQ